jgi:pyruvate kinase
MRRTKIICTLGPAVNSLEMIRELIRSGMDVARLNFSHGTSDSHAQFARWVRQAAIQLGRPVALLQDLSGPKIRTGALRAHRPVSLRRGQRFWLTPENIAGSSRRVSITFPHLARDARVGDRILLDDGSIELRVCGKKGKDVETEVIQGGLLKEHKGVNLPGVRLRVEALTEKDERDLALGIDLGVDCIALSFVRRAADVRRLKQILRRRRVSIPVFAKLEKPEAIGDLEAILDASDGVMVARGDLGVEMAPERVPLIQKRIIQRASQKRLPVITATQMLESMTANLRPTRAEASDVANAILDGTDAVMLSGETASGRHPIEALTMMARIAEETEQARQETPPRRRGRIVDVAEAICESVVHAAQTLKVRAIVAFTRSGSTARLISKYRPPRPVFAFCHDERIARRAALYWGTIPLVLPLEVDPDSTLAAAETELLRRRYVSRGDILAVVSGSPGKPGQTNEMKLIRVSA